MIRILVVCLAPQRLLDQIHLAQGLVTSGDFEFLFVCSREIPAHLAKRVLASGFRAVLLYPGGIADIEAGIENGLSRPPSAQAAGFRNGGGIRRFLKSALQWTSLSQYLLERRLSRRLLRLKAGAVRILSEYRPDVVLSFGDRHGDIEAAVAKSARERSIPVVLPYMAFSDVKSLVTQRKGNFLHANSFLSPLYYKWVCRRHPETVRDGVLFYVPFQVRALDRFGALPENPWTFGCGLSDAVCVDNLSTLERYVSYGVDPGRLHILGDTAYDSLFERHQERNFISQRLRGRYSFLPDRKIIMVALPQLAEHDLLPWDVHFREIDFIMETLAACGQNVAVSLHPKQDRARYAYLEGKYGCRLLDGRLMDWLPAADVFVATYSSTVIWAVLCGIPSVVVDFYGLDYAMFDFLTSPKVIKSHADFPQAVKSALASNPDFSRDWESLSRNFVFDGRTTERLRGLLMELASSGKAE